MSGQNVDDGAGTFQLPALIHAGEAPYDASPYPARWGDYSGIAVDPFDGDPTVWVAAEYMRASGGMDWGSWIAKISRASGCTLPASATRLGATAGDGQVALAWTASAGALEYDVKRATTADGPYITIASSAAGTGYTTPTW